MAKMTVKLKDGYKVSCSGKEETIKTVTLREPTTHDMFMIAEESEKCINTELGPVLVISPALLDLNTTRYAIGAVGDISGPLSMEEMGKFTPSDFKIISEAVHDMEDALSVAVQAALAEKRGRS